MNDPTRTTPPLPESLRRAMWCWLGSLGLPLLKRRSCRGRIRTFDGLNLVVLHGVQDPVLLRSGA